MDKEVSSDDATGQNSKESSPKKQLPEQLSQNLDEMIKKAKHGSDVTNKVNAADKFSSYTYKAEFADRSVAEIGWSLDVVKRVELIDSKLKLVEDLTDDLEITVTDMKEHWDDAFRRYISPMHYIAKCLESRIDDIREVACKQKIGNTQSKSTKCLKKITVLREIIQSLTEYQRESRHFKPLVYYDEECVDEEELPEEDDSEVIPSVQPAIFHGANKIQEMLDQRNQNMGNYDAKTSSHLSQGQQRRGPFAPRPFPPRKLNFARGEETSCDLDDKELPLAWRLPKKPLAAHLVVDINNLQKASAILKFTGDIRDYMNWRSCFLETVHYK
ncbi:Hypothetical predicted protein, partial [Paramuricea clavata]